MAIKHFFIDTVVTSGSAQSQWLTWVNEGRAYSAEAFTGVGGGLRGYVQLYNPLGSGIDIYVRAMHIRGVNCNVAFIGSSLPTLYSTTKIGNLRPDLQGTNPSAAELRTELVVTGAGVVGTSDLVWSTAQDDAQTYSVYPPNNVDSWAAILKEGYGIVAVGPVAQICLAGFIWAEVVPS